MIKQLRLFSTLLLLAVASMAWGEEVTYTLQLSSTNKFAATGLTDDNATWTFSGTSDVTCGNWNSTDYFGQQFGTGSTQGSATFATESFTGVIKEVKVISQTGTKGGATVEVKVGGSSFGVQNMKVPSATKEQPGELTFTGNAAGKLEIILTQTVKKAMYLSSIVVTYSTDAATKENAGLQYSVSTFTANIGESNVFPELSNPNNLPVSYSSSNESVATVSNEGVVSIIATGETTISAISEETTEYYAGSASYVLTVVDPNGPGTESNPYTVAQARAAIDAGTGVTGVYVSGIVSEIVTAFNSQYGNISFNISEDGTTEASQLQAYRCFKGANKTHFESADDIMVGDKVVLFGNLTKYNSTYELAEGNYVVSLERENAKESAGISFSASSYTATVGEANEFPTLENPNNLTVTYTSSNTNVATIDAEGNVTLVAAGFTTIKATTEETEEYYAGDASYTLTVKEKIANAVTWDLTKDETETASDEELSWTSEQATMVAAKANASTNTNNYYPGTEGQSYTSTRFYKGSTLTIAPVEGYELTSIVFTATTSNYATALANSTWTNATATAEDVTVTITPTDGASPVVAAIGGTTGHKEVIVIYQKSTKANPQLSFTETAFTVEPNTDFTAPTLTNPHNLTVTYSSNNEDVAMVDEASGEVVIGNEGEATITATFAGNDDYRAGSASYTITVKAKELVPVATIESITPTDIECGTDGKFVATVTVAEGVADDDYDISYSSSDENILMVQENGEYLAGDEAGTVKVTVHVEAIDNTTYSNVDKEFTIKVNAPVVPGTDIYEIVTDATTLAAGDQLLIAYVNDLEEVSLTMGSQNKNNRAAVKVTVNENKTITPYSDAQVVKLEGETGAWYFNVGDGYLYAASSSSNNLKTEAEADDNAKASIAITDGEATIIFQGTNTRNVMRFNPNTQSGVSNPLFSCYSETSDYGSLPQLYRKVASEEGVKGDVNKDGGVTIADVTALVNIILGKDETEPYTYDHKAADVNGDGTTTIADVTALVNIILGKN